jgi:hypothetical protein
MSERPKLGEQIQAVRAGARVLSGAEKPPSVARQREYLSACATAGAETLAWLRDNEAGIRKGRDALALLRRRLPDLPADMRGEVVALLRGAEDPRKAVRS